MYIYLHQRPLCCQEQILYSPRETRAFFRAARDTEKGGQGKPCPPFCTAVCAYSRSMSPVFFSLIT